MDLTILFASAPVKLELCLLLLHRIAVFDETPLVSRPGGSNIDIKMVGTYHSTGTQKSRFITEKNKKSRNLGFRVHEIQQALKKISKIDPQSQNFPPNGSSSIRFSQY